MLNTTFVFTFLLVLLRELSKSCICILEAYMFKYDSTHGVYQDDIKVVDDSTLEIGGHTIKVFGKR